ncbi:MAG TPA: LON peptidase substrate-binding domain-containing protein [Dehalococcoidia bacterium]|nr:LON peptidase substrate-binding domain-containing protein [Dehalococcoidia bacterium]
MELPLFPLQTVLFPGATIPLHIFEERYKEMINMCVGEQRPFGVVLIRSGEEAGGPAEAFDMGTTAYVTSVQHLEEGKMNLMCLGGKRFRVNSTSEDQPYLVGEVELVDTVAEDDEETRELADTAGSLFAEYLRLYLAMSNQWARSVEMPSEPDRLADYIASRLAIDFWTKQELLEELSAHNRLAKEIDLLSEVIQEMTPRVESVRAARWYGFAVMN